MATQSTIILHFSKSKYHFQGIINMHEKYNTNKDGLIDCGYSKCAGVYLRDERIFPLLVFNGGGGELG